MGSDKSKRDRGQSADISKQTNAFSTSVNKYVWIYQNVLSGGRKLSNMEQVFDEFPLSAKEIFEDLDNKNLTKCREICKLWRDFIDNEKIVWNRILMKFPSGEGLNLWQLNEENRLVNKALNLDWKYGDRNWDFDRHFSVVFVVDTINVLEIIWPDMKKKVREGAEVDMQLLKEETEEESEKFQKWEREPESYISRNIQYKKKRRKEWMKIRSLWSNMPGQEKYLEVSHCGKLLTVQGPRHGRTEMHVAAMTGQTKFSKQCSKRLMIRTPWMIIGILHFTMLQKEVTTQFAN